MGVVLGESRGLWAKLGNFPARLLFLSELRYSFWGRSAAITKNPRRAVLLAPPLPMATVYTPITLTLENLVSAPRFPQFWRGMPS